MLNNRFLLYLSPLILALLAGCSSSKPPVATAPAASAPVTTPAIVAAQPAGQPAPNKSDPYVAAVRASTMSGYPGSTIGKAFEGTFPDAAWHSQQTKEGVHTVNFTGTLPPHARRDCVPAKERPKTSVCTQDAKVTFQWTFDSDGRLFHLSYVDPEPWPEERRSTRDMLLFIFG